MGLNVTRKPTTVALGIVDLLKLRRFDPGRPTKLVRHADVPRCRVILDDLVRREGWFEFFQATQGRPRFDGCERIVSFIGTESYAKDVVVAHEQRYMKKLGTQATGLNWQPVLRKPHTPPINSEGKP